MKLNYWELDGVVLMSLLHLLLFGALTALSTLAAKAEFIPSEHSTTAEMYGSCDDLLAGRYVGGHPETCDLMFKAANVQKMIVEKLDLCIPEQITSQMKAYVFVRYYLETYFKMPERERLQLNSKPWLTVAGDAYLSRWRCYPSNR